MPLTDTAVRGAKPEEKPRRLYDSRGLYLEVSPAGGRWWRLKYRFGGKEKRLSLGTYPDTSLRDARDRRDEARRLLAAGTDPAEQRKAEKAAGADRAANSFEVIAREWHALRSKTWSQIHSKNVLDRFVRDVFPWIGAKPVAEITAPELLSALRKLEKRGAIESAHRALQCCGQVFRYAIASGRADRNPAADLRGALEPVKETHRAALTDPGSVAGLLKAIDGYSGRPVTKAALKLAPLLFVRPGELRKAEWSEVDLDAGLWVIPADRMKMRESHIVPLARQAQEILRDLRPLTSSGRYVFPCARSPRRPMSNNAVLAALRRMGFEKDEMSGHGFRAMARTILDEVLRVRPDFVEHQLAHAVRDPNGRAYNRTAFLAERTRMMQDWADYLDRLKSPAAPRKVAS
ncbi:MAG: integrase arm-type DNA-binding domain-containing protein [Xanthomonadales bacterium]|nr:integrase arm-type DNA-binding domain-containing protein [Xanthomonadales bacterium]